MKSDRAAGFADADKKKVDKDRKKGKRFQEETSSQERHETTKEQEIKTHVCSHYSALSDSLEESEKVIPEHQKKRIHHRSTYAGTSAFIPHDILKRPSVVSAAARHHFFTASCTYQSCN